MTTGALIFAFNNSDFDYVQMAAWSAERIKKYLNIPVAVITNDESAEKYKIFDHVINTEVVWNGHHRHFDDLGKSVPWYNANRVDAYALSPWDQTLVLDADYVVNSTQLSEYLKYQTDFMCHRYALNVTTGDNKNWDLNYFGSYRFPMWWATVMIFQKSTIAKYIFDSMSMIKNNWQHYRDLYGIARPTYRNDHALSISLGLVNGHTFKTTDIPGPLLSVTPEVVLTQVDQEAFLLKWTNAQQQLKYQHISGTDFHAMGKRYLGDIIANSR